MKYELIFNNDPDKAIIGKYETGYHTLTGIFEIVGVTPQRYKVRVIREMQNGNDPKLDTWVGVEEKTVSHTTMLKMQKDFCRHQRVELIDAQLLKFLRLNKPTRKL